MRAASSWDGLLASLDLPPSLGAKLAIAAALPAAVAVWLAARLGVEELAIVPPLLLHAALWTGWLLWLGRFRPCGVRLTSLRRWFVLDALPGAALAFAQMLWPAVSGVGRVGAESGFAGARAAGFAVLAGGLALFVAGTRALGVTRLMFVQEFASIPLRLETRGVYAKLRHPGFAGALLVSVGAALIVGNGALALAAINVAVLPFYIWLEDRRLVRAHGAAYAQYMTRVPAVLPLGG